MADDQSSQERSGRRRINVFRVAVLVAALGALIVSAAVTVGASPSPGGQSPAASHGPSGAGRGPGGSFRGLPGLGFPGLGGFGDLRGFGSFRAIGGITITKVDGSSISLKTDDGWTRTITVTPTTTIMKGSQKGSLSDLHVGDAIRFSQTKASDGTYSVTRIVVIVPRIAGTVSAVNGSGFTLKERDGSTKSVSVSGSTTFTFGAKAGSKSDVTVGAKVDVEGTAGSGDNFSAAVVHVQVALVGGTVTATTADSITIKKFDGSTATIHVGSGTTFRVRGVTSPKISDIKVGTVVTASGRLRTDGSLDAQTVLNGGTRGPDKRLTIPKPKASAPSS